MSITAVNSILLCIKNVLLLSKNSYRLKYFLTQMSLQKTFLETTEFLTRKDMLLLFCASTVSNTVAV